MIRNIKHIILLLALTLTALQAQAQQWSVGVAAGYDYNTLTKDVGYAYDLHYKGRGGLTVAVPVQVDFSDWFALRADLTYMQKNYRLQQQLVVNTNTVTNSYLQLPLMAHMSFGGNRLRGYVNLGAYLAYWAGSKRKGTVASFQPYDAIYDYNESYSFSPDDRRWDTGFMGGLGVEYKLADAYTLFAEASYYYSTTSQSRLHVAGSHPTYNNTIATQLGIRFNISQLLGKK